jgi:sugar phosphate isomerase/epimerase
MTHWEELYRAFPEIHFVFDTKMADFHRQMELLYKEEYAWLWKENHIRHYHVNDYGGDYMEWSNLKVLPVGKGHIDFGRFFAFLKRTGYRGDLTLEATGFDPTGRVDFDMLNSQLEKVRELLAAE